MNQLIPNNFSRASRKSAQRGVFLNGGPDGAFPFVTYLHFGRAAYAWCALFAAHLERNKPTPRATAWASPFLPAGYVSPRFQGDDVLDREIVVRNTHKPDPRLVAALETLRAMPLQNEPARMSWPRPKPTAGNWAPSRWFVQPRAFGEGYDVCTYVALGRLYPASSYPLHLVVVAIEGEPFRDAQDAQDLAHKLNRTPTWFPETGAWRLVTATELGPGREVPRLRQPRPLSDLWDAVKETGDTLALLVRYYYRKIVVYLTK